MLERGARSVRALYSVQEVCRILRPGMTSRKVHYWLHTGLLGDPVRREQQGRPTLLSFDQLIKVRVVQRLRDELGFSLPRVRDAVEWVLIALVEPNWGYIEFFRTGTGQIGVRDSRGIEMAIGGQLVISDAVPRLNAFIRSAREEWETGVVSIQDFPRVVSDASVMGGAPVVRGTRVETAFLAHLAGAMSYRELREAFDQVPTTSLREALAFEGVDVAA
jgi:uncharacterized protein (DUF433 family)/DNA-binding transcriptional MerR regulator